jgi:hypothetical protein
VSRYRKRKAPGPKKRFPAIDPKERARLLDQNRLARARARYQRAIRNGITSLRADGDTSAQVEHYFQQRSLMQTLEQKTRQVLCAHGVPVLQFLLYLNFCRQVAKLQRTFEGEVLEQEVAVAVAMWVAKGLNMQVLEDIRNKVFGIPAPKGP